MVSKDPDIRLPFGWCCMEGCLETSRNFNMDRRTPCFLLCLNDRTILKKIFFFVQVQHGALLRHAMPDRVYVLHIINIYKHIYNVALKPSTTSAFFFVQVQHSALLRHTMPDRVCVLHIINIYTHTYNVGLKPSTTSGLMC